MCAKMYLKVFSLTVKSPTLGPRLKPIQSPLPRTRVLRRIGLLVFLATVLGSLVACHSSSVGTNSDAITATALRDIYQAPDTYADHRAQQQLFASATGGQIAYTDHGTGPALVLLHGVPTSSWMYRKVLPELQLHFRTISIDLLGYGSSDKPEATNDLYSATQQAARVHALLNHLGIQRYTLMMHDMGGLVAWEMLRAHPQSVANLIVQNTIIRDEGFKNPDIKPGAMARRVTRAYSNSWSSAAILTMSFRSLGLTGNASLNEAECEGYVIPMREGNGDALYAFFTSLDDTLFERLDSNAERFAEFSGDTLILWGGEDKVLTTQQLPFLTENLQIKPENIRVYEDNDHFLVEEIPTEVIAQVVRFMSTASD